MEEQTLTTPSGSLADSGTQTPSGTRKPRQTQIACDRCRGQKLRCIRSQTQSDVCERCQKAGAVCRVDPTVRMGRPQRKDTEQHGAPGKGNSKVAKRKLGQDASTSSRTMGSQENEVEYDEVIDLSRLPDLTGLDPLPNASYVDQVQPANDPFNLNWCHVSPPAFDFGILNLETADYSLSDWSSQPTWPAALSDQVVQENQLSAYQKASSPSKLQTSAVVGFRACLSSEKVSELLKTAPVLSNVTQQGCIERVSNLNLELRRQSRKVQHLADLQARKEYGHRGMSYLADNNDGYGVCSAILGMVQALQIFYEILVELERSTSNPTDYGQSTHPETGVETASKRGLINLLRLTDNENVTPPLPSSTGQKSGQGTNSFPGPAEPLSLDVPTSLLIISCYITLINFNREVVAVIRAALSLPGDRASLLSPLDLQIGGLPIYQDPDLQIIVFVQFVVRMVDVIGDSLARLSTSPENAPTSVGKALPARLLDLALKQEGADAEAGSFTPIDALKEEIRGLNRIVYKLV